VLTVSIGMGNVHNAVNALASLLLLYGSITVSTLCKHILRNIYLGAFRLTYVAFGFVLRTLLLMLSFYAYLRTNHSVNRIAVGHA